MMARGSWLMAHGQWRVAQGSKLGGGNDQKQFFIIGSSMTIVFGQTFQVICTHSQGLASLDIVDVQNCACHAVLIFCGCTCPSISPFLVAGILKFTGFANPHTSIWNLCAFRLYRKLLLLSSPVEGFFLFVRTSCWFSLPLRECIWFS